MSAIYTRADLRKYRCPQCAGYEDDDGERGMRIQEAMVCVPNGPARITACGFRVICGNPMSTHPDITGLCATESEAIGYAIKECEDYGIEPDREVSA